MSDTTPTTSPEAQAVLDDFDVFEWLNETQLPVTTVEVYNDGDTIAQLTELTQFVKATDEMRKATKDKKLAPKSIADDDEERTSAYVDAVAKIKELREKLAPSALTFNLKGMSNGERQVLIKSLARKLKKRDAVAQELNDKGEVVKEGFDAIPGGEQHPDFGAALQNELISRCITGVTKNGKSIPRKFSVEEIEKLRVSLPGLEFTRLSNTVYDLNYSAYQIDQLVTEDFS